MVDKENTTHPVYPNICVQKQRYYCVDENERAISTYYKDNKRNYLRRGSQSSFNTLQDI